MALPTTQSLTTQLQNESVRTQPTTPMDGNVTRPMLIADLLKSMRDVNFSQLVSEYGSMAGMRDTEVTPMTNALMAEKERVPATPMKQATAKPPKQTKQPKITMPSQQKVPTPMTNAMAQNTMSPIGTVQEQKKGLMLNTPQQIA